jgi:hypothetical protein
VLAVVPNGLGLENVVRRGELELGSVVEGDEATGEDIFSASLRRYSSFSGEFGRSG